MEETYQDIVLQWYNKVRPLFVNTLRSRFCELDYDTILDGILYGYAAGSGDRYAQYMNEEDFAAYASSGWI